MTKVTHAQQRFMALGGGREIDVPQESSISVPPRSVKEWQDRACELAAKVRELEAKLEGQGSQKKLAPQSDGRIRTVLATRNWKADLETCQLRILEGETYHDAGWSIFDCVVRSGIQRGWFVPATKTKDTVMVGYDYGIW